MSKKTNRSKFKKCNCNSDYRKVLLNLLYPPFWDDGDKLYPNHQKGFKSYGIRKKQLYSSEIRRFKTWKHNRKTQWKK